MGIRLWKRIRIAKGINLNISKGGIGISGGMKNFHVGLGPKGLYTSASVPGIGLYGISHFGHKKSRHNSANTTQPATALRSGFTLKLPREIRSDKYLFVIYNSVFLLLLFNTGTFFFSVIAFILWFSYFSKKSEIRTQIARGNQLILKEDWPGLQQLLRDLFQKYPEAPDFRAYLGMAYLLDNKFDEGIPLLESFVELKDVGNVRLFLAVSCHEAGHFERALFHFDRTGTEYKAILKITNIIADCYLQLKKPELALALLDSGPVRTTKIDSDILEFRYLLGRAFMALGESRKARTQLSKVYAHDRSYKDIEVLCTELGVVKE